MSVRKIRPNTRSSTGCHFSIKNSKQLEFESSLEQDLLYRLDLDPNVIWFDVQPLKIDFRDRSGRLRHYTPDVLVKYSTPFNTLFYSLIEVKYLDDLDDGWHELKHRMRGGGLYAEEQGWMFQVLTEHEIRGPELWNAKFLWEFCRRPQDLEQQAWVLNAIQRDGQTSIAEFFSKLCPFTKSLSSNYTVAFYQLLAGNKIQYHRGVKLSPNSRIWA